MRFSDPEPRRLRRLFRASPVGVLGWIAVAAGHAWAAEPSTTFEEHVLPLFREKCCGCHNPDKKKGGLDLSSYSQAMAGGASGEVIAAGDAEGSYLWQLASHAAEPKMPPDADRIPDDMLAVVTRWIKGGAIERPGGAPVARKGNAALALDPRAAIVPEGPPVMPPRLPLEPLSLAARPLAITALAASPNGSLVAAGGRRQVMLFDGASLAFLGPLPFPEGDVKSLRFSRNAKLLLAAGGVGAKSGRVVVWDVATAKRVIEVGDEFDQVLAADITADQSTVAFGGPQKVVRLVRCADGQVVSAIDRHTDWITAVEFSPDGSFLATGDRAGNAFVWETRGAREHAVLGGHAGGITAVAWRPDGAVVATASDDGKVRLWDRPSGSKIKEWEAHPRGTLGLAWLADGRLATCGRDRKAAIWKTDGSREREFELLPEIGLRVAVTSDQSRIFVGDLSGRLAAFASGDGRMAGVMETNPPALATLLQRTESRVAERSAAHAQADAALGQARKAVEDALAAVKAVEQTATERAAEADATRAALTAAQAEEAKLRAEIEFSRKSRQP